MMGLTVKDIDKVILNLFHMITKANEKYEQDKREKKGMEKTKK